MTKTMCIKGGKIILFMGLAVLLLDLCCSKRLLDGQMDKIYAGIKRNIQSE